MSLSISDSLRDELIACGQGQLLDHARSLPAELQQTFAAELASVDWSLIQRLVATGQAAGTDDQRMAALAMRAEPPRSLVRQPATPESAAAWQRARQLGHEALRGARVGVVIVAGGQGTRLGFDAPKGLFPIGPISGKSLFQWFCEQLRARRERSGQPIPCAIMTSDATHRETAEFLARYDNFGLPADELRLFQQGHLPAVEITTGQALLSAPGRLAFSPDGHGGMLAAMARAQILSDWAARGIETLFYHQVDNPSTPVCDPAFIGWHLQEHAEVTTIVVAKRTATEKMGVLATIDGVTQIIEYSDLPLEIAQQTDSRGRIRLWAGNTAMHVFQREFLERASQDERALPCHVARKIVPYWDAERGPVAPATPNAFKFERFIFDVLPWAQAALVIEGRRADVFNPVKNGAGDDSPETARAALMAQHRDWLRRAGVEIADDVQVEISPLVALEPDDLCGRLPSGLKLTSPLYLTESWLREIRAQHGTPPA